MYKLVRTSKSPESTAALPLFAESNSATSISACTAAFALRRKPGFIPIANLEDEESIQSALMEVINALMRNTIDLKRATLILRALHIAVKNAHRVRYGAHSSSMVKEVPDFPASDRPAPDAAEIADAI